MIRKPHIARRYIFHYCMWYVYSFRGGKRPVGMFRTMDKAFEFAKRISK